MGQCQSTVNWFFNLFTEAFIHRHLIFSIREVTVGTSPRVEGSELLGNLLSLSHSFFFNILFVAIVLFLVRFMITIMSTLSLLLVLLLHSFFKSLVLFLDPSFYATHMEWLVTLTTIPQCTALVYRIRTNTALNCAIAQSLHEEPALFTQVLVLTQEIFVIVFDCSLVLSVALTIIPLSKLQSLITQLLLLVSITDKLAS